MTEFEKAYESRFLRDNNIESIDAEYRKWLLKGCGENSPSNPPEEERIAAENWCKRCRELIDEAKDLATAGIVRTGLEFDDLKRRAIAIADECFVGSDRGIVFAYCAQAYDKARQSAKESETREKIEKWIPYDRMETEKFKAVCEIQRLAAFGDGYEERLGNVCAEFMRNYNDAQLCELAQANGRLFSKLKDEAYTFGFKSNGEKLLKSRLFEVGFPDSGTFKFLHDKIFESYQSGVIALKRQRGLRNIEKSGNCAPIPNADESWTVVEKKFTEALNDTAKMEFKSSRNPNSILNLKPCKKWTIVSDETGSQFGNNAFEGRKESGKYVFVLIPEGARLPELKSGWHAVDETLESIISATDALYQSGAGIIGIPVAALYPTNRELWLASVETLLDITLRLLPVDGDTEVVLNIEKRGDVFDLNIADRVMHRLSLVDSDKAKKIHLKVNFVNKSDCSFNGYADAVAYSWFGKGIKPVFNKYGWVGSCLIDGSAKVVDVFHRCLDLVNFHKVLSEGDWNILVLGARNSDSLIGALLNAYGDEARRDVKRWRTYLDYVLSHLDSKAIQLSSLMPQISWLKEYEPVDAAIPPRLRLLWLAAQLAASNHTGGIVFGSEQYVNEFTELSNQLKDEDAPLVCFAALHLAVELTDAYLFEDARSLLQKWEDEPVAVPGLRYHAQALSSLGQHAAFLGENEKALEYFDRAMGEFSKLSDDWQRDFDQTCAYAVIAAMDCASLDFERLMSTYLYGGEWNVETMIDMAQQFAAVGENEPDSKYAHAILLRYLATLPENDPIRAAYVAKAEEWKWSMDGHPWELIAFYRAMLLPADAPERVKWLKKGYELSLEGGPTLQVIASVIGAELLLSGGISADEYLDKVEEVAAKLPSVGEDRLTALRAQVNAPIPALELAKKILPFNFR
jgi:hypothetical protein